MSVSSPATTQKAAGRVPGGLILSMGFWACVFSAGVLFGTVSVAPRLVERAQLERTFAARQGELLTLQGEVTRLERVAEGIRNDRSFSRAVARQELQRPATAPRVLPVHGALRYDPRDAPPEPVDVFYHEPWYLPVLTMLSNSPEQRRQWSLVAAGLLVFGFVFLHENAGSRAVLVAMLAPWRGLLRRYGRARNQA